MMQCAFGVHTCKYSKQIVFVPSFCAITQGTYLGVSLCLSCDVLYCRVDFEPCLLSCPGVR